MLRRRIWIVFRGRAPNRQHNSFAPTSLSCALCNLDYGLRERVISRSSSTLFYHLMTEKTPNNDHLYERNNNLCISGLPVTYNQRILVLDPPSLCARFSYHNTIKRTFGLACVFVRGHITSVTILLNGVECAMATPSAENLDSSEPSAASDVIKCVVLFRERGTRGINFNRKEKFRAVFNRNYKTLRRIRETVR